MNAEWLLALAFLLLAVALVGAARALWVEHDPPRPPRSRHAPEPVVGVEAIEDKLVYTDQLLSECITRAQFRLRVLEQLDQVVNKAATSLTCAARR